MMNQQQQLQAYISNIVLQQLHRANPATNARAPPQAAAAPQALPIPTQQAVGPTAHTPVAAVVYNTNVPNIGHVPAAAAATTPNAQLRRRNSNVSTCSSTATLGRSSSGASVRSFSSTRQLDFSENSEEEDSASSSRKARKRRKRRTPSDPQQAAIIRIVTIPVLEKFDKKYCAPRRSPLFKRRFRKTRNPDGTRTLKKNPEIVMSLFKGLVKPVLRRLLSNLNLETVANPHDLFRRYFKAALKVVKKRRANHVQSWRLNSCHKRLIYDAPALIAEETVPVEVTVQRADSTGSSASAGSASSASQQADDDTEFWEEEDITAEFDPLSVEESQHCPSSASATIKCAICQKMLDKENAFPKPNGEWCDGEAPEPQKCKKCWQKSLGQEILTHICDQSERQKQMNKLTGNKRKRGADNKGKKKRKKPKQNAASGVGQSPTRRRGRRNANFMGPTHLRQPTPRL